MAHRNVPPVPFPEIDPEEFDGYMGPPVPLPNIDPSEFEGYVNVPPVALPQETSSAMAHRSNPNDGLTDEEREAIRQATGAIDALAGPGAGRRVMRDAQPTRARTPWWQSLSQPAMSTFRSGSRYIPQSMSQGLLRYGPTALAVGGALTGAPWLAGVPGSAGGAGGGMTSVNDPSQTGSGFWGRIGLGDASGAERANLLLQALTTGLWYKGARDDRKDEQKERQRILRERAEQGRMLGQLMRGR